MTKSAQEIALELRAYADKLLTIAALLEEPLPEMPTLEELNDEAEAHYAPFGYKADGTPRKRPGPTRETQLKAAMTRARNRAKPRPKPKPLRLNVLSSTHPTEQELKDREVVHTTEEPA